MEAKEKAKEMVEKFLKEIPRSEYGLPLLAAKQCALIACDEIIELVSNFTWHKDEMNFFIKVKSEIEKM